MRYAHRSSIQGRLVELNTNLVVCGRVLERCLVLTETWTTGYNLLRIGDLLIKMDKKLDKTSI